MQAFLNQKSVKTTFLNRVKAHQKADEIVKGHYWEDGKGCAVGCTIHSGNHKSYEDQLGIPEWLALVEDSLFEGMSVEKSKKWPFEFLNAIKVGVDLNQIQAPFQIIVLQKNLKILNSLKVDEKEFPDVAKCIIGSKEAVQTVLNLWKKGKPDESAAESAAWSAAESAARSAAESAARSAAWSARSAAESAARSAAESATFDELADELLKLIKACK